MSKRNCKKGKPCGRSCISQHKICRIEASPPLSSGLSELVKSITDPKAKEERRKNLKLDVESFKNYSKKELADTKDWLKAAIQEEKEGSNKLKLEHLIRKYLAIRYMEREAYKELRAKEGKAKDMVEGSPKYKVTPGSREPIPYLDKNKELERLNSRIKELEEKLKTLDPNSQEHYFANQERITLDQHRKGALDYGIFHSPSLKDIYEMQGFNSKPEVVLNKSDLETRKDIVRHPDGRPLILYRGIKEEAYSDQFKAGDTHYTGKGMLGDGTYAASAPFDPKSRLGKDLKDESHAKETAVGYAGGDYTNNLNRKVTAFSLREDAVIVTIPEGGKKVFDKWTAEVIAEAEKKTGYRFTDPGHAAAALGIDAYNVRGAGYAQDYWVVLNRGAVIAAVNSQIEDKK